MIMLLALALVASPAAVSHDDVINDVCGYALESVANEGDQRGYEIYVGRMEIRMNDLGMDDTAKSGMRIVCKAYLLGAQKSLDIFGREMASKTSQR